MRALWVHREEWSSPCPSLVWDEGAGRHWCQEVKDNPELSENLAINEGCCSDLNSWRYQPLIDRTGKGEKDNAPTAVLQSKDFPALQAKQLRVWRRLDIID